MEASELIAALVETTLAASAAVLLVLALRRPLRKAFGPVIAYGLWLLVPAAIIAVMLPAAQAPAVVEALSGPVGTVHTSAPVAVMAAVDHAVWLASLWLLGALAMAIRLMVQQRAFCRRMGKLRWLGGGVSQAEGVAGLPAVIGLVQPLIVLPGDFQSRYTPTERRLMRAHEAMHVHSGDPRFNGLAALLRCVFWFNPLLHAASRHFRHDQELACDQRVIACHPQDRRHYGEAMLKAQLAAQPLPLGCHWGYSHPLKERIAMLTQPVTSPTRWRTGSAVLVALLLTSGVAAWAAQPKAAAEAGSIIEAPPPPPAAPAPLLAEAPPPPPAVPDAPPAPPAPPPDGVSPPPAPPAPSAPAAPKPPRPPGEAPSPPQSASATRVPAPAYPPEALASGTSGKVVLVIDVDAQGKPMDIQVERSEPAGVFDQATKEAAMKWKFAPAVENGRAIASRIRVPVEFKAPKTAKAPAATGDMR